jgi:putative ABC transport system substrate-binding protein
MRRREFIGLIGAAALSSTRGFAQTNTGLPVIGLLMPFKQDDDLTKLQLAAIRKGLQEAGFIEGKNCSLAMRFGGDFDRIPSLAKELGALNAQAIITIGFGAGVAHTALPEMPIVFTGFAVDPIKLGLAASYTHPGGMLTGNVLNAVGGEGGLVQKRIEFLKQIIPDLTKLCLIGSDQAISVMSEKDALEEAAAHFGFEYVHYSIGTVAANFKRDLEDAFVAARRDDVSVFYVSGGPDMLANLSLITSLVAASGKPSVGTFPIWGRRGLLLSYSVDALDQIRRAGIYAARILKGEKPGDLPIEQASKFTLVINLKIAKALGLTVPTTLLALADEVIE